MNCLTIKHLPTEILEKILRYVVSRSPKDLNSCSDTCQLWKELIRGILKTKCKILRN